MDDKVKDLLKLIAEHKGVILMPSAKSWKIVRKKFSTIAAIPDTPENETIAIYDIPIYFSDGGFQGLLQELEDTKQELLKNSIRLEIAMKKPESIT